MAWSDAARRAALEARRRRSRIAYRGDTRGVGRAQKAFEMNEGYGRTEVAGPLNKALRIGSVLTPQQDKIAAGLDRVMKQLRTKRNTLLFHGGTLPDASRIPLPNFLSTSRRSKFAGHFGKVSGILVAKGTPYALGDYHEQERILPRGGRLRLLGTTKKGRKIYSYSLRRPKHSSKLDRIKATAEERRYRAAERAHYEEQGKRK